MSEYWPEFEGELPEEFYGEEGEGFSEGPVEEEFAAEQLYRYHTALDERVCGRCAPLEGVLFSLDEVNEQFPAADDFEDIIFANVHDRCRCQLTREPQPQQEQEGGTEGMVEGRGTPLTGTAGLIRAARSPRQLMRYGARYGLRGVLGLMGLSALAPFLLPLIFSFFMPIVTSLIQAQVRAQVEAEIRRRQEIEEKRRVERMRATYRTVMPG